MKKISVLLILSFTIFSLAKSQTTFPKEQEAFYKKAMTQINPRYVKWIKTNAKNIGDKNLNEAQIKSLVSQDKNLGLNQNGTIEAMVFLVLMEASRNAEAEMKELAKEIEATNKKQKLLLTAIENLNKSNSSVTNLQLDSIKLLLVKKPAKPIKNNKQRIYKPNNNVTVVPKAEVDITREKAKAELDSLDEMEEMQSLKLQMMMDRKTKNETTLSNILKKISDTQDEIIKNMK